MKTKRFLFLATGISLVMALTFSCTSSDDNSGGGNNGDGGSCDIKDYNSVPIGDQVWMARNLNCNVSGSRCYKDDHANCTKYGRLYNWETAKTICPSGWHLPSNEEWNKLIDYIESSKERPTDIGSTYYAGIYLKAKNGWGSCGPSGSDIYLCEDAYGFSALPGGGYRIYGGGYFFDAGLDDGPDGGYWWSISEYSNDKAYYQAMENHSDGVSHGDSEKANLYSVRCVKSGVDGNSNSSSSRNNVSDVPRSSSSSNITNSELYCYGYSNYKDCNLIGGRWIPDAQYCLSGGGNIVNADYCYRNGITIDDSPGSSSSGNTIQSSSSVILSSSSVCSYGEGSPLTYNNQTYKTVEIGCQTWMAENLNYAALSSKCYQNDPANCETYGRLYNWVTAMDLPASCENTSCASQINVKHRGVCPAGWHIPSHADWSKLSDFTRTSFLDRPDNSGKYLKAKEGWYDCGPSGSDKSYSCEDTYGFAALPGGYGYSDGLFSSAGYGGYWWSSSETDSSSAYFKYVNNNVDYAYWWPSNKYQPHSIRCVQD
jgi:uncharacterized protein (TIGR02145 family)